MNKKESLMKFSTVYHKSKALGFTQYRSLYQALQYKRLFNELSKLRLKLPSEPSALDWGGGQGHCSVMLSQLGYKTTLFSIIPYESIWKKIAPMGVDVEYQHEGIQEIKLPDDRYNIAVSCGVLEHVRETGGNELSSLKELKRVTKDYIIIYHLPNKYSWIEWVSRNFRPNKYSHPFRYTETDVKNLVQLVGGLKIEKSSMYGVLPRRIGKHVSNRYLSLAIDWLDWFLCNTPLVNFGQAYYFIIKVVN